MQLQGSAFLNPTQPTYMQVPGPIGVTASALCPGPTDTPMIREMKTEGGGKLIEALERAVPMRRLGRPEDVAAAVAFFASDEAGFVTGQTLSVSGGLTMA